jgi:GNAT superfamily N-acetyltransferase
MLDKESSNAQISVGVTYASLLSAASLFFTGILIAQFKSFNVTIKVPIVYLIISTFSFIFAATIYSNAGSEITLGKLKTVEKYMVYSKNIVEILGLYPFILATPLVIGATTKDSFLLLSSITVAIGGFALFSQSKFSVLEKELKTQQKRYLSLLIVGLSLLLYLTQASAQAQSGSLLLYSTVAVVLMAVLMITTVQFSLKSKQYKPVTVRSYSDDDAETLSAIIVKNLDRVKNSSYPRSVIDAVKEHASPAAVRKLAKDKRLFVAEYDNKTVGLISFNANQITNIFTDPGLHRKGVGRILVDRIENEVTSLDYKDIEALANEVDHGFYKKLGYIDVHEFTGDDENKVILMRKKIVENAN